MESADVRAAFARTLEQTRARLLKLRETVQMPLSKPKDCPLWLRGTIVLSFAILAINAIFFFEPAKVFVAWATTSLSLSGKDIIDGLGTLAATFIGAWLAFRFARIQRDKERVSSEVAAGNQALFILSEIWNTQRLHQKLIVEPYRGKRDSWLNLNVSQPFDEHHATFDGKELSFLLQDYAAEYQRLFLEAQRYRMAANLVKQHRELVLTQVFPLLSDAGIKKEPRPNAEIEAVLGFSVVHQLNVLTDSIIQNVDENVKSSFEAFKMLRSALKTIYPTHKFLYLKPDA
jgi:hypothetical protein